MSEHSQAERTLSNSRLPSTTRGPTAHVASLAVTYQPDTLALISPPSTQRRTPRKRHERCCKEGGLDGDNDGDTVDVASKKVAEDKAVDVSEENGYEGDRDGDNDGDTKDAVTKKNLEEVKKGSSVGSSKSLKKTAKETSKKTKKKLAAQENSD